MDVGIDRKIRVRSGHAGGIKHQNAVIVRGSADAVGVRDIQPASGPRDAAGPAEDLPGGILIAFGEGQLAHDGARRLAGYEWFLRQRGGSEKHEKKCCSIRSKQGNPKSRRCRFGGAIGRSKSESFSENRPADTASEP